MSGAIFSLASALLVAPADRDYIGADAIPTADTGATDPPAAPPAVVNPPASPVPAPAETIATEPPATPPAVSNPPVSPVPAPAVAPPPAAVSPPPAPGPAPAPAARPGPPEKKHPKWWGPFPRPKLTGFGGPLAHLTGLTGKFALFVGVGGGITIRQRVSIGGAAMWLLNPLDAGTTELGGRQRLNANYGGLLLDVVLYRKDRIDLSLAGLLGGGGACLQDPVRGTCYDRTPFFVGQPSLGVHVKLMPVVRLVFELGYRFVAAKAWSGPTSGPLSAPVGTVMVELGWF